MSKKIKLEQKTVEFIRFDKEWSVEIEETKDSFIGWIVNEDNVTKRVMFGVPKEQKYCNPPYTVTKEDFIKMVINEFEDEKQNFIEEEEEIESYYTKKYFNE